MKKILFVVLFGLFALGCTAQTRAKKFGGTSKVTLPAGTKLEMVTWKGDNLWVLFRNRNEGEKPTRYVLKESSAWGIMEGKILLEER